MMASHNLLQNFVAVVPPHYCSAHSNLSQSQLSPEEALRITVPQDHRGKLHSCQRYVVPQWHLLDKNGTSNLRNEGNSVDDLDADLQGCIDGWTYNMADRSSTIISDWHLVCDLHSLKQMGQTIYMGGVLVGAFLFGTLADKYGRRILLLMSYLLMAVSGTCAAFSPSFPLFCFFRFGCGMALSGIGLNTNLTNIPYRWFHESARWLALKNKPDQAIKGLKSVAKFNGRCDEGEKIDIKMLQESMKNEMSMSKGSYTALDLFRTPYMRISTVCLAAAWLSTSFAYYGLSMDLQKFGVDIYLIQVIFGVVDIPAKIIITVTMSYIGRRPSQSGALVIAGVTILINLLVPYDQQTLRTSLAVVGKGCLAASFNCCYLYTGELYPTIIRQNGMGLMSSMARVGAMVAPMVRLTGDYIPWLPGLIYGGAPIFSGVAAMFLPETLGTPLPDTVQDVEERGSGKRSKMSPKETIILEDTGANLLKPVA
ncbi:solute carrier family 22 member 6 [Neolamprologus brichardi]|uniref:solute carrier family 22 member 6 n=1 Tax=Neolamprologus brichardi TaxID=32507 RepID=UPI0003EC1A47|nr:solute carrier family 22 member 6 [Neolamprologus brichardi]